MPNLSDKQARERALDPQASFIVQAPAGSGKTELLSQRFLVLLNHIKVPEEILAITFTKKSAFEMRTRIINTLKNAAVSDEEPLLAHTKKTWQLARNVLKRNTQLKWNLLENTNRLRIQTIDSFNVSLTKQLPLLSNFGASPDITNDPSLLYIEAVQEFLTHLEEDVSWSNAIAQLLLHMDNDLGKVQKLLVTMLAKRDQWLTHIINNANDTDADMRKRLENYLNHVITDSLTQICDHFPKIHCEELLALARFSSCNKLASDPTYKNNKHSLIDISTFPGKNPSDLNHWLGLAELLLTEKDEWRKRFSVKEGFPAPSSSKNPAEKALYKEMKERAEALIGLFLENEELRSLFEKIRLLPSPKYQETQWKILQALHLILRIVVAQLKVTFQNYGQIDYIENAQAALTALGTDEAPTDIALALDYRIQHILVDEFQDTATTQYRLLEKLTIGWEHSDGRTLFVVGDPMQSIYRFREAEVGLFIRARKNGLRHVKLEPLTLSVNFRSTPEVVNWVNTNFKRILPSFENIASGAVSYSPSIANNASTTDTSSVEIHSFIKNTDDTDQADKIIELIHQAKQQNTDGKVAILVRTRSHLKAIIPALKAAKIAYRAIDIDPLNLRPAIQDLMALTRALLHPADRIAWLAILRAPWCGLSLSDLLILSGKSSHCHLWERLQLSNVIESLSPDGQQRLQRMLPILKTKVNERYRLNLRQWIESTWILLGGPACVEQLSELDDADAYFNLLERLDEGGDFAHIDLLDRFVEKLYAAPDNQADDRVQIMTIHNAKGLEFDTVILPHLERKASGDDKQLLLWMERPRENDNDLIIAPVHAIGDEPDTVYEYIKKQIREKSLYETGRLLYVAATRAKRKLHLLYSTNENNRIDQNSLLAQLWKSIKSNASEQSTSETTTEQTISVEQIQQPNRIKRLALYWTNPIQEYIDPSAIIFHNKDSGFHLPNHKSRLIGTVMHAILQQLSLCDSSWWLNQSLTNQTDYITSHLVQAGLLTGDIEHSVQLVFQGMNNIFNDERAQWILKPHAEAQSEFSLTSVINDEIKSLVIDRTFIDEDGVRWIIDYKTSILTYDDLNKFLSSEQKKYEKQLKQYHQAMQQLDTRQIKLGLYFPLIPAWREWSIG